MKTVFKVSEVLKLLEEDGWYLARQKGSHRQYKHLLKPGLVTVNGKPSDTLTAFLLKSISNQSGISFKDQPGE